MNAVLIFASVLLVAVLVSSLAERSVLSASVLFLVAGFLFSGPVLGVLSVEARNARVFLLAELALFAVLFTDGMRVGFGDLRSAWRLPGRALLLGMPLQMVCTALCGRYVANLPWQESWLIGAALAPTDPVFASAIIGREAVPGRLRHLLNVESGLNDGLALPFVVVILSLAAAEQPHWFSISTEVAAGVAVGVLIPLVAIKLEQSRLLAASPTYQPLNAFAIGLLVMGVAWRLHANQFLAAFAGGITVATIGPEVRDAFHRFGELVAELLKLAALLMFGALISPQILAQVSPGDYLFVALTLFVVRPLALGSALIGSDLDWKERIVATWFGPKGFASVVYGLIILKSNLANSDHLYHLIALVVAGSIVLHSSSDVAVARWFENAEDEPPSQNDSKPSAEPTA